MTFQKMHGRAEAGRKRKISARHAATDTAITPRAEDDRGEESRKGKVKARAEDDESEEGRKGKLVASGVMIRDESEEGRKGKVAARQVKTTTTGAVVVKPETTAATTTAKAIDTPPKVPPSNVVPIKVSTGSVASTSSTSLTTTSPAASASSLGSISSTLSDVLPSTTSGLPTAETTPATPTLPTTSAAGDIPLVTSSAQTPIDSGSSATSSDVPAATGGMGTGALLGIIGGIVGGLLVIGLVIAFFLRRLRKRNHARGAFKAETFRRSAIMLKNEKNEDDFRPRPPSMIERRNAATPVAGGNPRANLPAPSMVYPYLDQASNVPSARASLYGAEHPHQYPQFGARYSAVPSSPAGAPPQMYGAVSSAYSVPPLSPYSGAQYDQAGFGAPPVPGTYGPGAYAAYGPDPRYSQYPHQQLYPQFPHYQQQQQQKQQQHAQYTQQQHHQQAIGYGSPASEVLPDPFARSPSSPPPAPVERLAESTSGSSSSSSASGSSPMLTRNPTQSSDAPPAYTDDEDSARWAALRDQKRTHEIVMSLANDGPERTAEATVKQTTTAAAPTSRPTPVATGPRPNSSHTLYGEEDDAYGGM